MSHFLYALTSYIFTEFQTYFTVGIGRTFVVMLSLEIPPHLKCVATLLSKLTTGNNMFIVSVLFKVTVASCSFHLIVQCVRLAAGRRTLKM